MKRFFPRAVPEAFGLLGLLVLASASCSENHDVKPGAPVLTQLTILENGSTPTNIMADTPMCGTGPATATDAGTDDGATASSDASTDAASDASTDAASDASTDAASDASADAASDASADAASDAGADAGDDAGADMSIPDEPAATGAACDPAKHNVCKLGDAGWCRCLSDPADMTMKHGLWNCDPFSPTSVLIATFDRLLDTDPIDPGDASSSRDDIAMLTATPPPPKAIGSATDYSSTGSPTGSVFNAFGPAFFGNFRSGGPSLLVVGAPALATDAKITVTLDPTKVRAKDGKTAFTATGALAGGSISFMTGPFQVGIDVPTAPPPEAGASTSDDGGTDAAADGGASDASATDGAAGDASASDAGASDAPKVDAAIPDGGVGDANVGDASVVDASVGDASASDAKADAVASEAGSDAPPVITPAPTPGEPVPADMNMGAVTITFNNLVDGADVQMHITITENGQAFTDFSVDASAAPKLVLTPKTEWAKGKLYVVTVDADAADVVGDKLGMAVAASFVMAN